MEGNHHRINWHLKKKNKLSLKWTYFSVFTAPGSDILCSYWMIRKMKSTFFEFLRCLWRPQNESFFEYLVMLPSFYVVAKIITRLPEQTSPVPFRDDLFSLFKCEMFVLLRTNMQVLLNYNSVLIIAVDRMGSVPYVCHVFVFRDVKMGKSFCGCSSITTPTRVALLIYSLVRAPPCGHVGDIY